MNAKPRGLGRGLDALFEDEEATFAAASENAAPLLTGPRKTLGIGQLVPNPDQPRVIFDPAAIAELADSIKRHGLLQPILVRPMRGSKDMYEIVAGERRWRACQKAQIHEVPVIIRELDDGQVLQIALIENLQRQDLNAIEEARGYQRLIDEFSYSSENVGELVSKSRSHVANMIRLLSLPGSVQTMVSENKLSAGHARALIGAKNPALLAQEIISKGLSVRQTEKLAAEDAGRSIQHRAKSGQPTFKDANLLAVEKEIANALGLKVTITMAGETAGDLKVEFKNLDQLDDVIARLKQTPQKF